MMLIPDYQDTRISTDAVFTERQKANIIINLDDIDKIVVIKNGTRFLLEEYIKLVIADALSDVYMKGEQDETTAKEV